METLGKHFRSLTAAAMSRHGFAQADILSHWDEIAGSRLSALCQPERIKWPRGTEAQGGTLILKAAAGRALDVQYAVPGLIERINQFFGFQAIATIKVTQASQMAEDPPRVAPAKADDPQVLAKLEAITDHALKDALARLGGSLSRSPQQK